MPAKDRLTVSKDFLYRNPNRKANVYGFDPTSAVKLNLPIVTAVTAVDLEDGQTILLRVHEAVYNDTAPHTLLSEFQLRECVEKLDARSRKHGGDQT